MLLPKKRCTIFIIRNQLHVDAVDLVGDEVGGNDPHVEVRFFHL